MILLYMLVKVCVLNAYLLITYLRTYADTIYKAPEGIFPEAQVTVTCNLYYRRTIT